MPDFQLDIAFTNEQLNTLYATGSKVIIAKPAGGSEPNVAWQAFNGLQSNTVTWKEDYGIYVSTTQIEHGATLMKLSSTGVPAAANHLYTLEPSGAISEPTTGGAADSYSLLNQYQNQAYMTVGLYQDANVNGTQIAGHALSAVPVLLQSTALMTPFTTVYIWLQSDVESNTVVTTVTSPMTELKFGGGVDKYSVSYSDKTGTFIPA